MKAWIYIPILLVTSILYSRIFTGSPSDLYAHSKSTTARKPASVQIENCEGILNKIFSCKKL